MENRQAALSFNLGITNVPSDATCDDNALEECMGMVFDDGEHKVIQKPSVYIQNFVHTLLYVHEFNDETRYIYEKNAQIRWRTKNDATEHISLNLSGACRKVDSIGKILIVSDEGGLHYLVWKTDGYNPVDRPPLPNVKFVMRNSRSVKNEIECDGILEMGGESMDGVHYKKVNFKAGKQQAYNDAVIGLYSKNIKALNADKYFAEPFFACVALELYDGSYIYQSAPQLLFPCVRENSRANYRTADGHDFLSMETFGLELCFKANFDYLEFDDIVKDVVVFVTDGARVYNTTKDQSIRQKYHSNGTFRVFHDSVFNRSVSPPQNRRSLYLEDKFTDRESGEFLPLTPYSEDEIIQNISSNGLFYRLCSLGLKRNDDLGVNTNTDYHTTQSLIQSNVLENLTTQQRMPSDFHSRCSVNATAVETYNNRLHLANIERGFPPIEEYQIAYENIDVVVVDIYVHLLTDVGWEKVVARDISKSQKYDYYFYYPDHRAKQLELASNRKFELKEHPTLNGAFMLNALPTSEGAPVPETSSEDISSSMATVEKIPSQVYVSEANNPFIFPAANVVQLQSSEILAMSTLTHALSQGQFGQFPLVVFTNKGLWTLQVGGTGVYMSSHPMSRDVCSHVGTITQVDGAVFFASKKGLMMIVGDQVKCVSEHLSGKSDDPFTAFIDNEDCCIAYDYRDSLLWIFNGTETKCWVYSIKSGAFGQFEFGTGKAVTNVLNYYPDCLLQNADGVLSLLERPNISSDGQTYTAMLKTRPMKLENALALKSIRQIRTVRDMEGSVTYRLFASNNLKHWVELKALRGMPWKYYKLRFDFSDMKATDRFSGIVIVTQERRNNKLR